MHMKWQRKLTGISFWFDGAKTMKLGIGIIGAGGISRAHARGYLQIPDEARIVAVADVLQGRGEL